MVYTVGEYAEMATMNQLLYYDRKRNRMLSISVWPRYFTTQWLVRYSENELVWYDLTHDTKLDPDYVLIGEI